MPAPIIRSYLLRDVVDSTPQAIMALNPLVYTSSSEVPRHMYLSLCTLWTGVSGNVSAFNDQVVATSGTASNEAENTISISAFLRESVDDPDGVMADDLIGAENAIVKILFQTSKSLTPDEYSRTQDAELRVRLLLDANLRGKCNKPMHVPINNTDDLSIDKSYETFLCTWQQYLEDQNAIELVSIFTISYVRSFGKAIIP